VVREDVTRLLALAVLLVALPARASPCAEAIERVLLKLPNRTPDFAEHAPTIAAAIDRATTGTREASTLIAVGMYESGFLPRIQRGDCRCYVVRSQKQCECDWDGRVFRSRGWFQLQHTSAAPEWPDLIGLDQPTVDLNARVAFRILRRGYRKCRTVAGAISYYAVPSTCAWSGAPRRARFAAMVERKIGACR
jgi:hypothetical protein